MKFKPWFYLQETIDANTLGVIQGYVKNNIPNVSPEELDNELKQFQEDPNPVQRATIIKHLQNK